MGNPLIVLYNNTQIINKSLKLIINKGKRMNYEERMKDKIESLKNKDNLTILGIESSCDETSIAVVVNGQKVLSNVVSSQIPIHAEYGGVVPEIASRNHIVNIDFVYQQALKDANINKSDIDAVAVTYGPGLVGALLVGLNFAKGLAYGLDVPMIPVNHIAGHICANFIDFPDLKPPFVCLIVSGGHTAIVLQKSYTEHKLFGSTLDDAVGESFDKVARIMGLKYPGGPQVDKLAKQGKNNITFCKTHTFDNPYDVSYSGLKTAVINYVHNCEQKCIEYNVNDVCASFESQAFDDLIQKTINASIESGVNKIALAGGVAANSYLREKIAERAKKQGIEVYFPSMSLCGDNAAMIASAGYYKLKYGQVDVDLSINAQPTLPLDTEQSFINQ